ncbi:MAG: chorismate mutase [Eubacterium sp.]|nr:chorismate mutase [Eubacterium sp.]
MDELLKFREKIDKIDDEIVKLFLERIEVSKDVADYKIKTGKPVLDRERELSKLENLKKKAPEKFEALGIAELFEQIMAMSRKYQYIKMGEIGKSDDFGFKVVDDIPKTGVKVAYQGLPGAYSQQAASEYFGEGAEYVHVTTFREAVDTVKKGEADYAVLPFENSSAGIVADVYDLLVEYDTYIMDTFDIKIRHCLCGIKGSTLEDIKEIYSHPQAFMQSNEFIEEHKFNKINLANTAISARYISEQTDKTRGCICSENAAEIYGLEILERNINFTAKNTTKFIIISNKKVARKDANLICISFEMPHESGTLYQMLSHIIYNNLNMTSIQSRPIPDKKWEYRFYVEFEGGIKDKDVMNALTGITAEALNAKILGNY